MGACSVRRFEWKPANTKIEWTPGDVLHTVHGTFNLKQGVVNFDPDTGKASGRILVDFASGNTGSEARDSRVHRSALDSGKYPEAIFTPSRIEGTIAVPGTTKSTWMPVHNATITFEIPYVAWR